METVWRCSEFSSEVEKSFQFYEFLTILQRITSIFIVDVEFCRIFPDIGLVYKV